MLLCAFLALFLFFLYSKGSYTKEVEEKSETCKVLLCVRLIAVSLFKRFLFSNRNSGSSGCSSRL